MSVNTREEQAAILLTGLDAASAENVLRRLARRTAQPPAHANEPTQAGGATDEPSG